MSPAVDASAAVDQTGTWLLAAVAIFVALVILLVVAVQLLGPDPVQPPAAPRTPDRGSWQWVQADPDETRPIARGTASFAEPRRARPYVGLGRHSAGGGR